MVPICNTLSCFVQWWLVPQDGLVGEKCRALGRGAPAQVLDFREFTPGAGVRAARGARGGAEGGLAGRRSAGPPGGNGRASDPIAPDGFEPS